MKKDRGSITIITLVTILFMLSFLISTYMIISNRRQAQTEIKRETQEIYESDTENIDAIYNSYFADENEVIPISTLEQLFKVGTGEKTVINNKIYTLTSSANYKLMSNLNFKTADYEGQIPTENVTWTEVETTTQQVTNQVKNFSYTGNSQTYTAPATGTYQLQVWGAQGGYRSSSTYGGKGGYSIGTVSLKQGEKLYVYVGGAGGNTSTKTNGVVAGGYNGGGYRYGYKGGGGATDIRLVGGTWNNSASLLSRIIVAGGGGSDGASSKQGMYGGGTQGGSSTQSYTANSSACGKGGTQTYSGASTSTNASTQATSGLNSNSTSYYYGGFGFGGGRSISIKWIWRSWWRWLVWRFWDRPRQLR